MEIVAFHPHQMQRQICCVNIESPSTISDSSLACRGHKDTGTLGGSVGRGEEVTRGITEFRRRTQGQREGDRPR